MQKKIWIDPGPQRSASKELTAAFLRDYKNFIFILLPSCLLYKWAFWDDWQDCWLDWGCHVWCIRLQGLFNTGVFISPGYAIP